MFPERFTEGPPRPGSARPLCRGLGKAQLRSLTKSSVAHAMCCLVTELKRRLTSETHSSMCCYGDQKRGLEPGQAGPLGEQKYLRRLKSTGDPRPDPADRRPAGTAHAKGFLQAPSENLSPATRSPAHRPEPIRLLWPLLIFFELQLQEIVQELSHSSNLPRVWEFCGWGWRREQQ